MKVLGDVGAIRKHGRDLSSTIQGCAARIVVLRMSARIPTVFVSYLRAFFRALQKAMV